MAEIDTDILIVGSGVAGALLAAELAGPGLRVAILEAGPRVDRFDALEIFRSAAIKVPESPYPPTPQAPHPVSDRPDGWYRQAGPEPFKSTYLKLVGGTTWHWLGTALRFLPSDFRLHSTFGRGLDWPIGYDVLAPFYERAEAELGVAGDAADPLGSPRAGPFPMPAIPQSYLDRAFAEAMADSGLEVRPTPQARNAVERDGRPPCCGSASCIPICPIQAKYDATVHLAKAEAKGAQLHPETTAVFVEAGPGGRISGIRFRRPDGSAGRATATVYVVAAHGIETVRLLLNSGSERAPAGIANGSDQVGRNLMDHPVQLSWALADRPLWPYRGPLSTSGIENLRDGAFRSMRSAFRIEIGNDGWSWPTGAPASLAAELARRGLRGAALDAALKDQAARHLRLASLTEQLPEPENRVTLDPETRDMYGVPLPRIAYRVDGYARAGMAEARRAHEEIFRRVGSTGLEHSPDFQGAGHIIGTARMGADPRHSVVDAELRSHQHPNLFILGSAVFPTSATANPTLTIAALSLRAAGPVRAALAQ